MKIIDEFTAGDLIPDYLLTAEPNAQTSIPPRIQFLVDCTLIDHPEGYMLVPAKLSGPGAIIGALGGKDCSVSAPGRTVIIPFRFHTIGRDSDGGGKVSPDTPKPDEGHKFDWLRARIEAAAESDNAILRRIPFESVR